MRVDRKIQAWQSETPHLTRMPDPAELHLTFDTDRPFEVTITVSEFRLNRPVTSWVFDRHLLKTACVVNTDTPVEFGQGDVRVAQKAGALGLRLAHHDQGVLYVSCAAEPVKQFTAEVDRLSPLDTATVDVDAWLTELFEGGVS